MPTRDRWQQIADAFDKASELPSIERSRFMDSLRASDPDLATEVASLLAAHDTQGGILDEPAIDAHAVVEQLSKSPLESMIGRRIGPYEVEDHIGSGGMGEVYLARDVRLDRLVAIKTLPDIMLSDRERITRVRKEARAIAHLNHPNVATIYGLEEDEEGGVYLILEFIEGKSLRERLAEGPLTLNHALDICVQIARGLEAAHERGVIHRDLKPANVMVGPKDIVKILDFGLARRLGHDDASGPHTPNVEQTATTITGTPGYMSPEQALGEIENRATDVFAFGCIFYECLAGRRAFSAASARARIDAAIHAAPDFDLLPSDTPNQLVELTRACLEKSPTDRIHAMAEARRIIESMIDQSKAMRLREHPATPNNLPVDLTSFVGRTAELAHVSSLLGSNRLVTLTGVAGCGKTRLATRVARDTLTGQQDGVWLVELAPLAGVAEGDAPPQIAHAIGASLSMTSGATADAIVEHIGADAILLIIDNCEHLRAAVAETADALLRRCPNLTILATSREPLDVEGEQVFPVHPMPVPEEDTLDPTIAVENDAVVLFAERARLVDPTFEPGPECHARIAMICRQLDGIPLAIELAAARMRVLSLNQILERLSDRFSLLKRTATGGSPHQRTLYATIDWSYRLLTPEEQSLFRALSVFAGGWSLASATAVLDADDELEVLDGLAGLIDRSLVYSAGSPEEGERFFMLESIREFASRQLEDTLDVDTLLERHAIYFRDLAKEAEQHLRRVDQAVWFDRLERDHDNLLHVMRRSTSGRLPVAIGLATGASIARFWEARGHGALGLAIISELIDAAANEPASIDLCKIYKGGCTLAYSQGLYDIAERNAQGDLATATKLNDDRLMVSPQMMLGNVAWIRGDLDKASEHYERALELSRKHDDTANIAVSLGNLGNLADSRGLAEESLAYMRQALEIFEANGDLRDVSICLANMGNTSRQLGRDQDALEYSERSLVVARDNADPNATAVALIQIAQANTDLDRPGDGVAPLVEALRIVRKINDLRTACTALETCASLASRRSDVANAVAFSTAAESIRDETGAARTNYEDDAATALLKAAVDQLEPQTFESERARGSAMSFDLAIRTAISYLDPDSSFGSSSFVTPARR